MKQLFKNHILKYSDTAKLGKWMQTWCDNGKSEHEPGSGGTGLQFQPSAGRHRWSLRQPGLQRAF